ncbi:MAG: CoA transferase [Dehalococcoidia bacterium]|nr:CoA transferase [Dehalococcoidia bacterium]
MAGLMPLDDVRVIDLTLHTAGPFGTRILADYGADVIKVEPPGGDPARLLPPFPNNEPGLERSALFQLLNTNKRSVVLDLKTATGRDRVLQLVGTAHAVVESFAPGTLARLGLGYDVLRAVNPSIVLTSISNFGQHGPYRDYAATDITLYGMGGAMFGSGDVDHEPLKTSGRMASYHGGYVGALATTVALHAAAQRGEGEHVDVSIFEAATHSIDMRLGRLLGYQHSGRVVSRPGRASGVATGTFPCADGYFMLTGGGVYFTSTLRMVGRTDLLEQPEWATVEARAQPERIAEFEPILLEWTLAHTKAEIRRACQEHGVLGGPINTVADLLVDESFVERGFFQHVDHPVTGTLTIPGYHFRLHRDEGPMPPRRHAPLLGEHTADVLAALPAPTAAPHPIVAGDSNGAASPTSTPGARTTKLPLEGLRILDFTVVWAGPYSTMQLADWGAEVIRVESLQHMAASTRGALAHPPQAAVVASGNAGGGYPDDIGGARPWNRFAAFNHHARNKRSMTVDLTRPEGQQVLDRLVAMADGVIENNLPPNIEKQGITWERLSRINPRLVLVRMPGFGLDGPYRTYRTMGHHMESLAGHPAIRSYPDLSLEYIPIGVPSDAASGIGSALAFLTGLRYRERTGKGIQVELATAENFVPLMAEFVLDYTLNGRLYEQMGNDHWWLAPHNVYRCQGADRWVTIAVRDERDWRALCAALHHDEWLTDARFADMPARYANRRALDPLIEAWTATRDPYWVMQRLQLAGVPCGVVMNEADVYENRHHEARDFYQWVTHPEAGTQRQVGRAWRSSSAPSPAARHAPRLGEDNDYVYRELLGFSDAEYRRFEEAGHIGTDYDPSIA